MKKQLFGEMNVLTEKEFLDFYEATGLFNCFIVHFTSI